METLLQDIRYSLRMLLQRPTVTAAAILSLALGIGANITVFTWVKAILLDPFPGVSNAEQVVIVGGRSRTGAYNSLSYPDYRDLRERSREVLRGVIVQRDAAMALGTGNPDDQPERLWGALVPGDYFDVLGMSAELGRTFAPDEDQTPGTHAVAVISHGIWQRRFASATDVINRNITINGQPFRIIGVAPANFIGTFMGVATDVWVPLMMDRQISQTSRLEARGNRWLQGLAVMKPGVQRQQVQAVFSGIASQLGQTYPEDEGRGFSVYTAWDAPFGPPFVLRPVLMVLGGVVALVLLMACANVANLLLARTIARRREVAVRLSLGASRFRLLRQLLTESLVLALLGGVGGILAAYWAAGTLMAFMPPTDVPITLMLGLDRSTFAFALIVCTITGIVFGLAPALQALRSDLATNLKNETGGSLGGHLRSRLRGGLVIGQVAVSVLLLVCAGLFLKTVSQARNLDPGFGARNILLASYDLASLGYARDPGLNFHATVIDKVAQLPGVRSATLARRVPLGFDGSSSTRIDIDGYVPARDEEVVIEYNQVGPDYFKTMQAPLLRGREFTRQDTNDSTQVVIINETMARRYWRDRDALGSRIRLGDTWCDVVGIARDASYHNLAEPPMPYMYLPLLQNYSSGVVLHVATEGEPAEALQSIRETLRGMDANLPLFEVKTMSEHLQFAVFAQHIAATLLSTMGGLALVLAMVGLYGVVTYTVNQRIREVGIRMALGAQRKDILRMIVARGAMLAFLGIAIGWLLAFAGTRFLSKLLQGVSPTDPLIFVAVPALLAAVAIFASLLPARRATQTDPMIALRYE